MAGQLVRKLRGHDKAVLCCVAAQASRHLLASSSEDGTACVFDIRCKSSVQRLQSFGGEAVVSVYLHPGNENVLYAAAGKSVYVWDLRLGSSGTELHKYSFNKDEINQLAVNKKATFLAAADDTGEIKIVDLSSHKLYKTLRGAHTNLCSSVQFHPQRSWEVLSGALDCRIVKWEFSRGRPLKEINLAVSSEGASQICNPPFIHSLAVAEAGLSGEAGRTIVAARGDGAVDVFDVDFKGPMLPEASSSKKKSGNLSGGMTTLVADDELGRSSSELPGRLCHLASSNGGHTSAVSTATFARFGRPVQYIVSGGNDSCIKLWEWANQRHRGDGAIYETKNKLILDIQHRKKVRVQQSLGILLSLLLTSG